MRTIISPFAAAGLAWRKALTDHADTADAALGVVLDIQAGHGIHVHDDTCRVGCGKHFDDADWVVGVRYNSYHQAVYGILGTDVQLWMD